jgi:ribosome-associated toxin RatA of RatAB toxin-antitoxin module
MASHRALDTSGMTMLPPFELGAMPTDRSMTTIDELHVRAPLATIFALAADVEQWPSHLAHYRYVRFHERRSDGGGIVEMSANRPFGALAWPTWWTSQMSVVPPNATAAPAVRFRHVGGVTTGMDVEWSFAPTAHGTDVRIVHVWNGPPVPVLGVVAARAVIGPVFVHGIAARTLAGLARAAERSAAGARSTDPHNPTR